MKTEKDIKSCCGETVYYYTSTHQEIHCKKCKKELTKLHSYRPWYDDWSPDYDCDVLVQAWNKALLR